jgi:MFS family permease
MVYLLTICLIFNFFIIDIFYTSLVQYCIMFVFLIISTNLLESVATSMFSKIIPSDYEVCKKNAGFVIQIMMSIGRILGSLMLSIAGTSTDENLNRIAFSITFALFFICFMVLVYYYSNLRVKAIARILRGRSMRKLKDSEF